MPETVPFKTVILKFKVCAIKQIQMLQNYYIQEMFIEGTKNIINMAVSTISSTPKRIEHKL